MANENLEDLIALARRGELSAPEQRRLEMALKTSDSARALHEVGVAFDRMTTERAGDDALFERVARTVGERAGTSVPSSKRKGRARRLVLLAALGLGTSAAAASAVGVRWSMPDPVQPKAPGTRSLDVPTNGPSARQAPAPAVKVEDIEPEATTVARAKGDDPAGSDEPRAGSANRAVASVAAVDAERLFRKANAERKAGQSAQALAGYRRLQQSFPASPEARLSFVLSGRLLLARGQASQALSQFNRYLSGGGQGGLGEEALWGKAQALSRLGRSAEERQVWRTLLDRYPESVYAPTARRRLER